MKDIDLNILLLRSLFDYDNFKKYYHLVNLKDIKNEYSKELFELFRNLEECITSLGRTIELREFIAYVEATSGEISPVTQRLFEQLVPASNSVGSDVCSILLRKHVERSELNRLAVLAYEASSGRTTPETFHRAYESYSRSVTETNIGNQVTPVSNDLNLLLDEQFQKPGLRWRLNCLNKALGSLRKGDFGFIFARPESGKTTFLADQISYMSQQVEGPIVWINNEEQGGKVKLRCYTAAVGKTLDDISKHRDEIQKTREFQVVSDRVLLYDAVGMGKSELEKLLDDIKPSLIVFDQIDKIQGFEADREDLHLGAIYQWAREIAKKHCPVIGVSQADGTGEGVKWLTMSNVANAKTAKQAEADWILGIGKIHDQGFESVRFLNISKNKLLGDEDSDPSMRHGKFEVLIKPEIARYEDILYK